jgi:hypothetical protein
VLLQAKKRAVFLQVEQLAELQVEFLQVGSLRAEFLQVE